MKTKNLKYEILLALAIISLLSSLILSFTPIPKSCDINGEGCDAVYNSSYNYTFGIKNSYYGVFIFLFLSLLIYSQIKKPTDVKRNIIHIAIIFGSIVATFFLYIQQFVLDTYCKYCVIVDISLLLSLLVIIFNWKK